jgi:transposase InsO family protein
VRAKAYFADVGIAVQAVMTGNGSCYRSHDFAAALGNSVKHRHSRPYHPQTCGKV